MKTTLWRAAGMGVLVLAFGSILAAQSAAGDTVTFTEDLHTGSVSSQVQSLQQRLNGLGFTVASTGPGSSGNETTYFGQQTKRALILFQERYAAEILAPVGLTSGTGNFFRSTRNFMNSDPRVARSETRPAVSLPTPLVISTTRHHRSSSGVTTPIATSTTPLTYSIGGTLSGLTGTIVLQNNGADNLSRSSNGSFTFSQTFSNMLSYVVSIFTQPDNEFCVPSNAVGTVSGNNVSSVSVDCYTYPTLALGDMTKFFTFATRTFTLAPATNSSGILTYRSSNTSIATISGSTVTMVGIGTTTITVIQATSSPYAASTTSAILQAYVDECSTEPCENAGTCSNVPPDSFMCSCQAGFSGTLCELSTYNCDGTGDNFCLNGGTCMADTLGGSCSCPAGWFGTYCEMLDTNAAA